MPIHLSVPSILSKQTLIHSIISNILSAKDSDEMNTFRSTGTIPNAPSSYLVTTYGSRGARLSDTTLTLLTQSGSISSESWVDLFDERSGTLNTGVSKVKLMDASTESETNFQVYGTLSLGGNVNELTVAIDTDTLPSDSTETPAVTAIIDPTVNYPGDGTLAALVVGQRYLLTNDLPVITEWDSLSGVKKYDIIEYLGAGTGTVTVGPTLSLSTEETSPRGITFNNDGTKMFIVGWTGGDVNEYTLSIGFDISSTVTFVDSFDVSSQEKFPSAVKFNADGTKMFITGTQYSNVHEYALTTGFDVSTASFTQTLVTTVDNDNFGLDFKPDGTKMYITGEDNDKIFEFNLSTGFDISTATFNQDFHVGIKDGTWDSGDWEPFGIEFSTDGTRLFIVGTGGNEVNLYKLSTAFDISTATFEERYVIGGNPSGIHFSPDGTKMFTVGNLVPHLVRSYTLSIPYVFTESMPGWTLSFDASETSTIKFTTNTQDSKKHKWNGSNWSLAIERDYISGYWRIYL